MADGRLRLGLVGAGPWGRIILRTLADQDDIRVAMVASNNPATRGLLSEDAGVVGDWRDLLGSKMIDALVVATPPHVVPDIVEAAIAAGLPVFAEKPVVMDPARGRRIEEAAVKAGAIVHVDHIDLDNPGFVALRTRLGELGRLGAIRAEVGNRWRTAGDISPLWEWGPHPVAMALDLGGPGERLIDARRLGPEPAETDAAATGEVFLVELDFPSGVRATIRTGNGMAVKRRSLIAEGERGALIYDDVGPVRLRFEPVEGSASDITVAEGRALQYALRRFVDAVRAGRPDCSGLAMGVRVAEILSAAEKRLS